MERNNKNRIRRFVWEHSKKKRIDLIGLSLIVGTYFGGMAATSFALRPYMTNAGPEVMGVALAIMGFWCIPTLIVTACWEYLHHPEETSSIASFIKRVYFHEYCPWQDVTIDEIG